MSYKNVGERDRRYSLLTKEFGLIQAIVRSVLKPNSKLAGHLEPPSFSWMELIETAKGFQLTQGLEQNSFSGLRKNPGAISLVLRLTKFLDDFLNFDSNSKIFSIWENFLVEIEKKVATNRDLDWQLLEAELVIVVLKELGLLPDIFHCSDCGENLEPGGGRFFCGRCFCFGCASAKGGSLSTGQAGVSGGKNQNISVSPSVDGLDKDFYSECRKILAGEVLFESRAASVIKKTAFYFKRQAQSYML